eukprot:1192491-Prorocentrum_minimum.AAC.8
MFRRHFTTRSSDSIIRLPQPGLHIDAADDVLEQRFQHRLVGPLLLLRPEVFQGELAARVARGAAGLHAQLRVREQVLHAARVTEIGLGPGARQRAHGALRHREGHLQPRIFHLAGVRACQLTHLVTKCLCNIQELAEKLYWVVCHQGASRAQPGKAASRLVVRVLIKRTVLCPLRGRVTLLSPLYSGLHPVSGYTGLYTPGYTGSGFTGLLRVTPVSPTSRVTPYSFRRESVGLPTVG